MKVELAKFIGIVKFLDAPHPISEKQTKHPIYPHLFGKPDYTPPARAPSPRKMKVDKSFDSYFRSKLSTINVTLNYSKDENERDIL